MSEYIDEQAPGREGWTLEEVIQARLDADQAALRRFDTDMLIMRGMSGDETVGHALNAVTSRARSIADLIAKDRKGQADFSLTVTLLTQQLRALDAEIAAKDRKIDELTEKIEALDVRLERIDWALEQLEAGRDPEALFAEEPELESEIEAYEEATGRTVDRSDPQALALVLEEQRRGVRAEQIRLKDDLKNERAERDDLQRRRDAIADDFEELRGEPAEMLMFKAHDEAAETTALEAAGRSDEYQAKFNAIARFDEAPADLSLPGLPDLGASFRESSARMDEIALDVDLSSLSAAGGIEASPIAADRITSAFNTGPQHDEGRAEPHDAPDLEKLKAFDPGTGLG